MVAITLPDDSVRNFEGPVSGAELAMDIGPGLLKAALAVRHEGEVKDLSTVFDTDTEVAIITARDPEALELIRHDTAHVLAEAVQELFPGTQVTIGPSIENGFYYDIDFMGASFSENDLQKIESKMKELAKPKNKYIRKEISKDEAVSYFEGKEDPYKLELLENLEDGTITFYTQGEFTDLCRGPHIPHTGFIKAVKLTAVAGAYWRGDEKNKQLTRVYGITFPKQAELTAHMELLEEAKKRDHRKLGKELELFTFSQKVGQGLPLWLPNGAALRERLENFLKRAQKKAGYDQVITPHIANKELYVCSGHYEKYGEDSFQPTKTPDPNEEFYLKRVRWPLKIQNQIKRTLCFLASNHKDVIILHFFIFNQIKTKKVLVCASLHTF